MTKNKAKFYTCTLCSGQGSVLRRTGKAGVFIRQPCPICQRTKYKPPDTENEMTKWAVVIRHAIFNIGIVENGKKLIKCAEYDFDSSNENCYSRILEKYRKEVINHNIGESDE